MKHDYTYDAARPAAAEIARLKAALAESEKQFQDKVYEIARLLDECDKAQGILKACLSVMPFGNIETHTVENLPGRIADLASEIASLSLENERLEAKLTEVVEAAGKAGWNGVENSKHLPTFIENLAEDLSKAQAELAARPQAAEIASLKATLFQAQEAAKGLLEQRDKAQAEISKWHAELSAVMPADFKDWHENAQAEWPAVAAQVIRNLQAREESALGMEKKAQAVAAVVEARMIRRMEAVPWRELDKAWDEASEKSLPQQSLEACFNAVRARLIAAAKGQPQAANEPAQPDPYSRLKAYAAAGARIRCGSPEAWRANVFWLWNAPPPTYEVHPDDLGMCPEYAPGTEVEKPWMSEARQIAAQCWCDPETSGTPMDGHLAEAVAKRIQAWMETSAQNQRNADYYRSLVVRCGRAMGEQAYIADDGGKHEDVLCAKVPELVEGLVAKIKPLPAEVSAEPEKAAEEKPCGLNSALDEWSADDGPQAASKADEPAQAQPCVCGSPTTIGTVHRSDGPCYQAEDQPTTSPSWKPAVGDVVRLKSGGPVMTVTDVDPLSLMCAWMNANNELQVEPITTLCLTPAQP